MRQRRRGWKKWFLSAADGVTRAFPDELRGKEDTARKVGQGAEGMPGLSAASVRNHFWKPVFWSRTIS